MSARPASSAPAAWRRVIEFPMDEAETAMFAKSAESVKGLIEACKAIDPSLA